MSPMSWSWKCVSSNSSESLFPRNYASQNHLTESPFIPSGLWTWRCAARRYVLGVGQSGYVTRQTQTLRRIGSVPLGNREFSATERAAGARAPSGAARRAYFQRRFAVPLVEVRWVRAPSFCGPPAPPPTERPAVDKTDGNQFGYAIPTHQTGARETNVVQDKS